MSDLVERLRVMIYEETLAKDARIAELESRCADKDASIGQLIEQLEKAEAHSQDKLGKLADLSNVSDSGLETPARTLGETQ